MSDRALLDGLLEPFASCLDQESLRRIAEFQIAPSIQLRVDCLAELANEGQLTEADRNEYEALINAADLIAIVQLKARRRLNSIPRQ